MHLSTSQILISLCLQRWWPVTTKDQRVPATFEQLCIRGIQDNHRVPSFPQLLWQTNCSWGTCINKKFKKETDGRRGNDRMVVGFTCAICAYHHWCREFESRSGRDVQHYVIKFVWLAAVLLFSLDTPASSTNKTDCHNITEILLKVALNTINQTINI